LIVRIANQAQAAQHLNTDLLEKISGQI